MVEQNWTHALPSDLLEDCDGFIFCLTEWAYEVTNGLFFPMILLGLCIVILISMSRFGTARAFGFSSFVGSLGAIWFSVIGLMSWWIASAFILAGAIGFAVIIMNNR